MNIFSRTMDILLAFICMFLLPFLLYRIEVFNASQEYAKKNADIFLERTAKAMALDEKILRQLENTGDPYGFVHCEAEIERTESIPGSDEQIRVRFSGEEVLKLIEKYGTIPLSESDRVTVRLETKGFLRLLPVSTVLYEKRM